MKIVTSGSDFLDIDGYAGIIAYSNLLKLKGIPSKCVSTAKLNESITPSILQLDIGLEKYEKSNDDEFIIVDVSIKNFFDNIVEEKKIVEVLDHHTGFEKYWKDRLGKNAKIEYIGAVATLIFEEYEKEGLIQKMSNQIAILLMAAILDNTLNFQAKITTERDKIAYNKLQLIANTNTDYAKNYFLECQEIIEKDLKSAIENDMKKLEKTYDILPPFFGQLTVWNKEFVLAKKDILYNTLNNFSDEWMINLICLEDSKSYIISTNKKVQRKIEKLFNKTFKNDTLVLDSVWLRKEIIKRAEDS